MSTSSKIKLSAKRDKNDKTKIKITKLSKTRHFDVQKNQHVKLITSSYQNIAFIQSYAFINLVRLRYNQDLIIKILHFTKNKVFHENPQIPADLITLAGEILNRKLHFFCSAVW